MAVFPWLMTSLLNDYGGPRFLSLIACIAPIFSVAPFTTAVSAVLNNRRHPGLHVTPDGIYSVSWLGGYFFDWKSISGIALTNSREFTLKLAVDATLNHQVPENGIMSRFKRFRANRSKIEVGYYAVHPAVVYYTLSFYLKHSELRHELGTQASVDRISSGDMPDAIREVRRYGVIRPTYWQTDTTTR